MLKTSPRLTFILQHTRLQPVPFVPELRLHLADEITPLWALTAKVVLTDVPPPFWAFAWAGGVALARYLLDNPAAVAGKSVLDFASGSGLCAIAALRAGAAEVLAADIDPFCANAIQLNASANAVNVDFTDRNLLDDDPPAVDLIIVGDICYEQPLADRVLAWLRLAHARGTSVLLGDPHRNYLPSGLLQLAGYDIPTSRDLEGVKVKRSSVFTFPD